MNARQHGAPAFACVSPRQKIKVDTVCVDRESAEFLLAGTLGEKGYKVRRVRVMLETTARKQPKGK